MARNPSPKQTPAPSPSPSPATPSSSASSSSLGGSAIATDQVDAEVIHAPKDTPPAPRRPGAHEEEEESEDVAERESDAAVQQTPAPIPPSGTQTHLGPTLNEINSPEAAVSALKAKLSILHTIGHNVSHFSTLAFNDVEQLLADVRWLVGYIRSKV